MLEAKIFKPIVSLVGSSTISANSGTEVLDASHFHARVVDINPIISEHISLLQNEHDREKVTSISNFARVRHAFVT